MDMSMKRLTHEGREKDKRLNDENDPYFNKKQEYAMAIYSYYQCFKCKKAFFGGLKNCENLR